MLNPSKLVQTLYLASVWLHVLAACTWIGGMAFLVLVAVPWLRSGEREAAGTFFRETGSRFRNVGWACFGVLLATGSFNLWMRGVRFTDFLHPAWLRSSFGEIVVCKIAAFIAVLTVSVLHDFSVGPRAAAEIVRDASSARASVLRRRASLLGRANAVLALILVACAVMIVPGAP